MTNPTQQSVLNRASTDKFILVLNLPNVLKNQFITAGNKISIDPLQLSVYGSIVPEIIIPAVPVSYSGQTYNVSSHTRPNYNPLVVNFIVDNEFQNYYTMWAWLNALNTADGSIYGGTSFDQPTRRTAVIPQGNMNEYQTNLTVYGLNEYNQRVIEFTYFNAFITNLGGINYNYQDPSQINITATFQYSKFETLLISNN